MKKVILTICTIIAIFSIVGSVYANSNIEKEVITKEYTREDFNKESFYKSLESEIEENGKSYILKGVTEKENQEILEQNVEVPKSKVVRTSNIRAVINEIESEFDYSQNGYNGKIILDKNTITIKPNNISTKEYKVYYEKSYNNLLTNDLKDIPKTLNINEVTYYLINPIWSIAETININGKEVPTKYNAVMQYEGLKSENVVIDYIANYKYKGTLQKQEIKSITYKVEYIEKIEETKQNNIVPIIATGSTGSIIFVCFIIFKMNNAKIYNYRDGKFKLIKRIYVKNAEDNIDLVNDKSITNKYKIKLSNHLYNKLKEHHISFKYYDKIYKYKVQEKEFEITV